MKFRRSGCLNLISRASFVVISLTSLWLILLQFSNISVSRFSPRFNCGSGDFEYYEVTLVCTLSELSLA